MRVPVTRFFENLVGCSPGMVLGSVNQEFNAIDNSTLSDKVLLGLVPGRLRDEGADLSIL
jgi:hypothetical protein